MVQNCPTWNSSRRSLFSSEEILKRVFPRLNECLTAGLESSILSLSLESVWAIAGGASLWLLSSIARVNFFLNAESCGKEREGLA